MPHKNRRPDVIRDAPFPKVLIQVTETKAELCPPILFMTGM